MPLTFFILDCAINKYLFILHFLGKKFLRFRHAEKVCTIVIFQVLFGESGMQETEISDQKVENKSRH